MYEEKMKLKDDKRRLIIKGKKLKETNWNEILASEDVNGDCSLVRRFCSPKVRKSEIKGSSFRRFCSPKVRKSDDDFYSFPL